MSLAAKTRKAVRARPFLLAALRAGVLNYAAAARFLDVGDDEEAVATALRRFAEDLPDFGTEERSARVTMETGLGVAEADDGGSSDGDGGPTAEDAGAAPLLVVGGVGFAPGEGSLTGVLATGDVDGRALSAALDRLATAGVAVEGAGVAGEALLVVVGRRDGANAVRAVEDALAAVPTAE